MSPNTEPTRLFIDGQWCDAENSETYNVHNPAHPDQIVGKAARASAEDSRKAIEAADRAFPGWSGLSYQERAEYLRKINNNLTSNAEALEERVHLFTQEHGKILFESRMEISRLGGRFELCADAAETLQADKEIAGPPFDSIVTHQARGVATLVVPWNWPLSILGAKLPQALITGNTVVVKLPQQVPLSTSLTLKIIAETLPPGVMNVLTGKASEMGDLILTHPLVRKVNFTGSIPVGQHVMRCAVDTLKHITLELGGNDAAIICEDANLDDDAINKMVMGSFSTTGQICMALKRLYVHESRHDELVEKFSARLDKYVVGDGLNPEVTMGPLNNANQLKKVKEFIQGARDSGATVTELGQIPDMDTYNQGYFQRPTLVTHVANDVPVVADEQFGPVLPILSFSSEQQALELANGIEFGLCSSVWTEDKDRALSIARRLEAGYTYLNNHGPAAQDHRAPFGGVKQSGIGRNLGIEGMLEFTEPHSISSSPGWLL